MKAAPCAWLLSFDFASPSRSVRIDPDLPGSVLPRLALNPLRGSHFPSLSLHRLYRGCRNLRLLSICFACRLIIRSRLTQGGRTFPWNPWAFGVQDSHLHLATHTGILTSMSSTDSHDSASMNMQRSPTIKIFQSLSAASADDLAPVHFRRRATRLVSCYALFKGWLLLSQPPSCPCVPTSFST